MPTELADGLGDEMSLSNVELKLGIRPKMVPRSALLHQFFSNEALD